MRIDGVCTVVLFFSNIGVDISFFLKILQYLLIVHSTQGEHRSGIT